MLREKRDENRVTSFLLKISYQRTSKNIHTQLCSIFFSLYFGFGLCFVATQVYRTTSTVPCVMRAFHPLGLGFIVTWFAHSRKKCGRRKKKSRVFDSNVKLQQSNGKCSLRNRLTMVHSIIRRVHRML